MKIRVTRGIILAVFFNQENGEFEIKKPFQMLQNASFEKCKTGPRGYNKESLGAWGCIFELSGNSG